MARFEFALPLALLACIAAVAETGAADTPRFAVPVDCRPGNDCWIINYFDHDPGSGVRDYACGVRSYDGHGGTDFGIRDLAVMSHGVPVLAAAPGLVSRVRDGMADIDVNEGGRSAVKGRECGNGVVLDHGGSWTTQYCHLRRDSVAVQPGDQVGAGHTLGFVGLSGLTEFPHVEFVVRHKGEKIDPFVGLEGAANCAAGPGTMWDATAQAALEYRPTVIFNSGFADMAPKLEEVRRGRHHQAVFTANAPALIFWVELFGVHAGDQITLSIKAPDGTFLVEHARTLQKTQAHRFQFAGKRRRDRNWASGRYRAEAVVVRRTDGTSQSFRRADSFEVR